MAGIDINPFGGMECLTSGMHDRTESRTDEPKDEHILLIPGVGGSTWKPE